MESTNKVTEAILTKTVRSHHRDWADRLPEALWAYLTTWHNIVFPIEFEIKTLKTAMEEKLDLTES